MEQHDELRAIAIQELRNRMDRALGESDRGEGADGEEFMQAMLDDLDAVKRRQTGAAFPDDATRSRHEVE
jgi:hypothetical protein